MKHLKDQDCELLLALTHLKLQQDKEVALACPELHAILGGHDHDPYFLIHNGVPIAKCGQNAATLVQIVYVQRVNVCQGLEGFDSYITCFFLFWVGFPNA